MKFLRVLAEALVLACFVIIPPALAEFGYTPAGVSLAAANAWLATQTFSADGIKIKDGDTNLTTLSGGAQNGDYKLTIPPLLGDANAICSYVSGNQFMYSGLWCPDSLTLEAAYTQNGVTLGSDASQTGLYTLRTPILAANDVLMTRTVPGPISDNLVIGTTGKGIQLKEAANGRAGVATLVAGTVTVANTSITSNTRIKLTPQNESGTAGSLGVSARANGASFTIKSYDGSGAAQTADTRIVYWEAQEPAP